MKRSVIGTILCLAVALPTALWEPNAHAQPVPPLGTLVSYTPKLLDDSTAVSTDTRRTSNGTEVRVRFAIPAQVTGNGCEAPVAQSIDEVWNSGWTWPRISVWGARRQGQAGCEQILHVHDVTLGYELVLYNPTPGETYAQSIIVGSEWAKVSYKYEVPK